MPEAYGGLGLGHIEALLVLEEFAQVSPAVAFPVFESATGPVRTVLHFAGESLRQRILPPVIRSEEHTSELQSLMRISYAVFCLKKKNTTSTTPNSVYKEFRVSKMQKV